MGPSPPADYGDEPGAPGRAVGHLNALECRSARVGASDVKLGSIYTHDHAADIAGPST